MFVPYYYTPDELNQLLLTSLNIFPVLIAVNTTGSNSTFWPWISPLQNSYFIYNLSSTELGIQGLCVTIIACKIVNFNNYAYSATRSISGDSFVNDGNTNTLGTSSAGGLLTWTQTSDLEILVYIFGNTTTIGISCTGGVCNTGTLTLGGANVYYTCRCPDRLLSYTLGTFKEIQIFNSGDLMRSTSYYYP